MITSALTMLLLAQTAKPEFSVSVKPGKAGAISGTVTVKLPEGWHAYQNPPKSEYENPLKIESKTKGFKLTKVSYPKGETLKSSGSKTLGYVGNVDIPFEGKFDTSIKPTKGTYSVAIEVSYQICSDRSCIAPDSTKLIIKWKATK